MTPTSLYQFVKYYNFPHFVHTRAPIIIMVQTYTALDKSQAPLQTFEYLRIRKS